MMEASGQVVETPNPPKVIKSTSGHPGVMYEHEGIYSHIIVLNNIMFEMNSQYNIFYKFSIQYSMACHFGVFYTGGSPSNMKDYKISIYIIYIVEY